jgi:two-component system cell cycle sensor histidine kinase/response regulator CckA
MSGPALAQKVRMARPNVKLLFMSGYPAGAPEALPGVPIVQKPFTLKTLAQKVREVLQDA